MSDRKEIKVQRANVVLDIAEDQLDYYMNQGYSVIDKAGNVIKASVPRELGTLQKAYVDNTKKIEDLEAEKVELLKQIKELKKKKSTRKGQENVSDI